MSRAPRKRKPASNRPDMRRGLPAVGALVEMPAARALVGVHGRGAVVTALREALAELREHGSAPPAADGLEAVILAAAAERLAGAASTGVARVINAAGIVVHTNLGRAPLAAEAVEAMAEAAGYSSLECDLESGERGSRRALLEPVLCAATDAEAGLAVNNCAGAVLLTLSALAAGHGVVTSRGELVEIGGGFRVPDVVVQGGARLIEVGATNRTRLADYERAIDGDVRAILRTHPSNFRMIGFTETVPLPELAALARGRNVALIEDLGGGALVDLSRWGLPAEPTVQASLKAGADLVLFSGDKLLGGPQAGLIVGRKALVDRIERHPLARALRIDKLSLAALIATLKLYREPSVEARIPVLRMLTARQETLECRARALAAAIGPAPAGWGVAVVETHGFAGGGAMPMRELPSWAVQITSRMGAGAPARLLRKGAPPLIGRIADDAVLLDVRTIADEELAEAAAVVRVAFAQ
jgi:L-seryl-tRNA(Ser) seleniumtransferase